MKTERQFVHGALARQGFWKRGRRLALAAGVLLIGCGSFLSCSEYDLDERTPAGWGMSIYSWMDGQGNYTNTVRLINDLGYREVLDKTGSKTLFVADDAAFERFFKKNDWGVSRYEDLSLAQKKMLIFGAMIDNSYQVQALSSTEGPIEGNCMRRPSSLSIYDSVPILKKQDVPDAIYWQMYKDRDDMVIMHDMTTVPMIHFIERFMANKQITNSDYDFLYNNTTKRQSGDASVNGSQIAEQNIKCMNGFVHRMNEVVTPLPNMADIIGSKPNVSIFNHLLQRYSVPDYCGDEVTRNYNVNRGTDVDSVFQRRFFAKRSIDGRSFTTTHNQKSEANGELKYDPGWNGYFILSNESNETALQQDMAVMLVPSDEALSDYWENGAGKVLKDNYGSWDNVPYSTLTEFMNANMLESFVSSVPSKFPNILNDAADPLGITTNDVDSVWLACNGAVYLTNRVFTPTSFVSVMYPTVVDPNMSIILWAIQQLNYEAYLNSLNSRYSFFLPSNDALQNYIDPVSYGRPQKQVLRFHYDPSKTDQNRVYASVHPYNPETGEVGDSINVLVNNGNKSVMEQNPILNCLYYILDDHVVIGDVEDGHEFYRTKGGSEIRVRNTAMGANGMTVEGTYHINQSEPLAVSFVYDQTNGGNGKTYILDKEPVMGTSKSVFNILGEHPEFSRFRELLEGSNLMEPTVHDGRYATSDTCLSVFNSYHYTVYVPTNESIDALIKAGKLHTWDEVADLDTMDASQNKRYHEISQNIENFLRYHIQDNAIFINADNSTGVETINEDGSFENSYETAYIDTKKGTFNKLTVKTDKNGSSIKVYDQAGNERTVQSTRPGLYNLTAREYTYNNSNRTNANAVHNSSSAVIHLIDGPLMIEN